MRGIGRVPLALLVCGMAGGAMAAERATPAEAQAMLDKAITHYKQAGRSQRS